MKEASTTKLSDRLLNSSSVDNYFQENRDDLVERTLAEYLQQLLAEKNRNRDPKDQLKKSDVFKRGGLTNTTYGYELFDGKKPKPTSKKPYVNRNTILQLAFGLSCTLKETDRLLQAAKCNNLYSKNRRDAIIMFCIEKRYSLEKTDEELYKRSYETIRPAQ